MNVLYLSYDGLTDPLGQSQILPYVIGLSKTDDRFTIISFEKERNYKENSEVIKALVVANNIEWIPLPYHYSPKVISTIYDSLMMWRRAIKVVKEKSIKVVHCRSYIPSLIGLGLKNKFKTKFIFDMRGFWVEERIEGGLWNPGSIIYQSVIRFFKKKEKAFLNQADAIICLTFKAEKIITEINSAYAQKIKVIPCCVDTERFSFSKYQTAEIEKVRNELGIRKEEFVLTYLGSIGTWYMLDEMLLFFKELLKVNQQSRFFFISNDSPDHIIAQAQKYTIPIDALLFKRLPNHQVPLYLSVSDYSIFFIKNTFSKQASSPTKQGEIMAMGIPIICNTGIGDTDDIVNKYQSGIQVHDLNSEGYRKVAELVKARQHIWKKNVLRDGAKDYFALDEGIKRYMEVYKSLFS